MTKVGKQSCHNRNNVHTNFFFKNGIVFFFMFWCQQKFFTVPLFLLLFFLTMWLVGLFSFLALLLPAGGLVLTLGLLLLWILPLGLLWHCILLALFDLRSVISRLILSRLKSTGRRWTSTNGLFVEPHKAWSWSKPVWRQEARKNKHETKTMCLGHYTFPIVSDRLNYCEEMIRSLSTTVFMTFRALQSLIRTLALLLGFPTEYWNSV